MDSLGVAATKTAAPFFIFSISMSSGFASIECTISKGVVSYRWIGPEDGEVIVSKEIVQYRADFPDCLPWKLERVGETMHGDTVYRRAR